MTATKAIKPGQELLTWSIDNATIAFTSLSIKNDGTAFNFSSCQSKENSCSFLSNSTALGVLYQLKYLDTELLRFYLSTPSEDWRVNQTYAWTLSQSWISQPQLTGNYYFWNIENHIKSEMIIPTGYSAFSCDYVELSYFPTTPRKALQRPKATLITTDFLIGFTEGRVYNPCGIGKCRSLNGSVTCGNAIYWHYLVVGIIAFCCMFCWILDMLRSRHASLWRRSYSAVLPHDDGIEMNLDRRRFRQIVSTDWDDEGSSVGDSEVL